MLMVQNQTVSAMSVKPCKFTIAEYLPLGCENPFGFRSSSPAFKQRGPRHGGVIEMYEIAVGDCRWRDVGQIRGLEQQLGIVHCNTGGKSVCQT